MSMVAWPRGSDFARVLPDDEDGSSREDGSSPMSSASARRPAISNHGISFSCRPLAASAIAAIWPHG